MSFLNEILKSNENIVLSLGGGTPCYYNNAELYVNQPEIKSFYLKASIDVLYERLVNNRENRPLLKELNENDLKEYIAKHLFERNEFYNKSDFIILIDNKSVNDILNEISIS